MSARLTYNQAATILGCHISNVAKLVAKGELTSTGRRGASLVTKEVEALARSRGLEREARAARPPRKYQRFDHRPDSDHEWLSTRQVAELLGVTKPAVIGRITREKLPAVENGGPRHLANRPGRPRDLRPRRVRRDSALDRGASV